MKPRATSREVETEELGDSLDRRGARSDGSRRTRAPRQDAARPLQPGAAHRAAQARGDAGRDRGRGYSRAGAPGREHVLADPRVARGAPHDGTRRPAPQAWPRRTGRGSARPRAEPDARRARSRSATTAPAISAWDPPASASSTAVRRRWSRGEMPPGRPKPGDFPGVSGERRRSSRRWATRSPLSGRWRQPARCEPRSRRPERRSAGTAMSSAAGSAASRGARTNAPADLGVDSSKDAQPLAARIARTTTNTR